MSPIFYLPFPASLFFDNLPDEANVFIYTCNVSLHFLGDRPPPYLRAQGLDDRPPALSEGLDPPLIFHNKVFLLANFRDVANAFYLKIDESSYSTKT